MRICVVNSGPYGFENVDEGGATAGVTFKNGGDCWWVSRVGGGGGGAAMRRYSTSIWILV